MRLNIFGNLNKELNIVNIKHVKFKTVLANKCNIETLMLILNMSIKIIVVKKQLC